MIGILTHPLKHDHLIFLVGGGVSLKFQSYDETPDISSPGALYSSAWAQLHARGGRIYWLRTRHAVPGINSEDGHSRKGPTKNFQKSPLCRKRIHIMSFAVGVFFCGMFDFTCRFQRTMNRLAPPLTYLHHLAAADHRVRSLKIP